MRIHVVAAGADVARAAADLLVRWLGEANGAPVLGLPTGRTAVPFYDELARRRQRGELDLSAARGFNLDELLLPAGHPGSFRRFMADHAWGRTGLDAARCDIPRGFTEDPAAECRRYERAIASAGGLGLAVLGIGAEGHVAYNLPGPPRTGVHRVELPAEQADRLGIGDAHRPLAAITVGLDALRSAGALLLMAVGAAKADAIRALREGPADPRWPCSLLRDHPRFDVVVDRAAAGAGGAA